ncbi:MAG: phage portal protein [Actinoplanes sp.]
MPDVTRPSGLIVRQIGPPDPQSLPPRSDVSPNENEPVGTVGPAPTADNAGFGSQHVMYPANDPPLEASAWAGWPVEWDTPNTNSLGAFGNAGDLDIVWAAIDLNARITADMPVFATKGNVPQPPPSWLANPQPEVYTSWAEMFKQAWWSYQAIGETFIVCTSRFADGFPRTFMVLNPMYVTAELNPSTGLRRYYVGGTDATDDMLHIRYTSINGDAHGHGPLEVAGARVTAARVFMRYSSDLARNGGIPWAVLKHKYRLTPQQAQALKAQWIAAARNRFGAPAILDSDAELQIAQVLPKDMALSELSDRTDARLATLLGVPAILLNLPVETGSMTYQNVESLYSSHWRTTLRPMSRFIIRALSGWALPAGNELEIDPESYIRADPTARANYYSIMIAAGIMTPDEARNLERLPPRGEIDSTPTHENQVTQNAGV